MSGKHCGLLCKYLQNKWPTDTSAFVGAIQPVVCEAMNFSLIQDFQPAEVLKA